MTQLLKKLKQWLATLAVWRKRQADVALPSEAEPTQRVTVDDAELASDTPVTKLGVLARLRNLFTLHRNPVEAVADTEVDIETDSGSAREATQRTRASDAPDEPEIRQPTLSVLARLKRSLSFRRKPTAIDIEVGENDKTLVIDKSKARSETPTIENEAETPQPSRAKRLLLRLRNKWVWIPAISLASVGIASWVLVVMLHTTQEKERLQAELKAAKKMLEKKSVATVVPPAAQALPAAAKIEPPKPEKKVDPAFQIIGHVPEPQAPETSDIDASDCVVKDKKSVAENLKNCITGFNQALARAPEKTKKP